MTVGGLRQFPLLDVDIWDATYDLVYARREACQPTYLPENWASYDVIHHNWHPIAANIYGPGHFDWDKGSGPLVSVYLNDIPPWSGCPFLDRAEVVVAPEETPAATIILPYPIPDWVDCSEVPPATEFTIGCSGVREDGFAPLRGACASRGWRLAEKPASTSGWTTPEDEIRRLAANTVNVCWYHQARGIAGTPSMMLASRRPLLLNSSPMFAPWWSERYAGELYREEAGGTDLPALEAALEKVEADWRAGTLRFPGPKVYADHGWLAEGARLVTHWLDTLEAR